MAQKQVFIGVIGVGGVGKCFLQQLKTIQTRFASVPNSPKISLIFLSRSKHNLYSSDYSPLADNLDADKVAQSSQELLSIPKVIEYLAAAPGKAILVDNTSSQELAEQYPVVLRSGVSVITPSKKAFSSSYSLWEEIHTAAAQSGAFVYHESSVCAGLPTLSTLKDLVNTGDEIQKIDGIFSGTMSFLFNSFAPVEGQGGKWSAEVLKAKELGYTEPDPRDDLNGLDVARKLTILARLAGLKVETSDFPVQSLIPKELESASSADEFMKRLPEFDDQMEEYKNAAAKNGKVVRFVGSIDFATKKIKVGLEEFDPSHPIAAIKGSGNILSFTTKRYPASLVIQGSGAGGEVTAMGISSDLLKVLERI